MGWLRLWWRQSDHYDRLSSRPQARGMDTLTRATIAVVAGWVGRRRPGDHLDPLWTPYGPRGVVPLVAR